MSNEIISIRADDVVDDDDNGDVNKLNLKTSVHYIFGSPHQTKKNCTLAFVLVHAFKPKKISLVENF